MVFPAEAASYYGPAEALREVLARDADTWRPVHREAAGNALKPAAQPGTILRKYPLVIAVDAEQHARVTLHGGLGFGYGDSISVKP